MQYKCRPFFVFMGKLKNFAARKYKHIYYTTK